MDVAGPNAPGGAANNSSDFVRKLYKMLEDPSYSQVVRWGDDMDSFVVLENEKFTKSILPKHFKHSNFASFVRQLNKYDFHKVRHNNEENGTSPYGAGAWEFKHPDFKANNKDALDNIRRKAPAPRKPTAVLEDGMPTQQMDLVNTQLVATQQQLRLLEERYNELSMHHSMLLQELIGVQKTVVNHEHVMRDVMDFLHTVDAKHRRDSRVGGPFAPPAPQNGGPAASAQQQQQPPPDLRSYDDEPASPLVNASKLLSEFNADMQLNYKNLEHMNEMHSRTIVMTTPPPEAPRSTTATAASKAGGGGASAASSTSLAYAKLNDLDSMVYPVGSNNGIDPMYSEHVNNIPYTMPPKDGASTATATAPYTQNRKRSAQVDPGWVRPPQILLVEDDPTCRRIGSKFLYSFRCSIDSALDGLEAVNKMNAGSKYDLVLMDIIMPQLDGVSACHLIRQFDATPIIAMTSNIRSDDISMYFQHGMNDVLPKPFTKEGLLNMLEKHLTHLKKIPDGMEMVPPTASTLGPASSTAHSMKEESPPGQSPSTVSNWNSPSQYTGISPASSTQYMAPVNTSGYGMDQSSLQYPSPTTPIGGRPPPPSQQQQQQHPPPGPPGPHRRQVSEMGGADDLGSDPKRPRIFATTNAAAMGQMRRGQPG